MEEGLSSIASRVCQGVRSCWTTRRQMSSYQRLPATPSSTRPAWRGIRLGRRRRRLVLGSTAWRSGSGSGRPPLRLLITRLVDACISSLLLRPLKAVVRGGFAPAQVAASEEEEGASPSSTPPKLRHDSSRRRRGGIGGGRGVMLNICVAEALLRRSSSQVRRSPLQAARKKGRQDREH